MLILAKSQTLMVAAALALGAATLAGCGDGKSGGRSYAEQVAAARAEPDAQSRATKLIVIGYRQGTKSQDILGAKRVLEFAELACRDIGEAEPRSNTYVLLGDAHARLGNRSEAIRALKEAAAAAEHVEDTERKAAALAGVAAIHANPLKDDSRASELFGKAAELAATINEPQGRALAQKDLGKALAKGGRTAEAANTLVAAYEFARSVADPYRRCDVLSQIAAAQLALERQTEAGLATIKIAIESARQVEKPFSQVYALTDVAKTLLEAKQPNLAKSVLDQATEGLKTIPEADLRAQAEDRVSKLRHKL